MTDKKMLGIMSANGIDFATINIMVKVYNVNNRQNMSKNGNEKVHIELTNTAQM